MLAAIVKYLAGNATATRGKGWMFDEARPTLTLTSPRHGTNPPLSRVLVGMVDYYTGLDMRSFQVTTSFPVDGVRAGQNLASRFRQVSDGVWELKLATPIQQLASGSISVSIKDQQGNVTRIERQFSVSAASAMQKPMLDVMALLRSLLTPSRASLSGRANPARRVGGS